MGCDCRSWFQLAVHKDVSIHAPAWGATCVAHTELHLLDVSIHAPAWGATDKGSS